MKRTTNNLLILFLESCSQKQNSLGHHMKFKMYGDQELDLKLLTTVRKVLGDDSVVIFDVNGRYKNRHSLMELSDTLNIFKCNDLSSNEDPAELSNKQWVELQKLVGDLDLIPDKPIHPAWKGMEIVKPDTGRIFNIHPSNIGSFRPTVDLAQKIKTFGGRVMIGDDNLVSPACTAWQQIGLGLGATWVETIEKKEDSKAFMNCVISSATKKQANGFYGLNHEPGFGLVLDEKRLKSSCSLYVAV